MPGSSTPSVNINPYSYTPYSSPYTPTPVISPSSYLNYMNATGGTGGLSGLAAWSQQQQQDQAMQQSVQSGVAQTLASTPGTPQYAATHGGSGASGTASTGSTGTQSGAPSYIGGTPGGATGNVSQFGFNTTPGPAQGGSGALGQVPYQAPNPWANHLLPNSTPVNPTDPAANLFTSMAPSSITPTGGAGAGSTGAGGLMPGQMPTGGRVGVPMVPQGGLAQASGQQPSPPPQFMGPGNQSGVPNFGGSGGFMPPGRPSMGGLGSMMFGGGPQIGGYPTPSGTLAMGNPASPYYMGNNPTGATSRQVSPTTTASGQPLPSMGRNPYYGAMSGAGNLGNTGALSTMPYMMMAHGGHVPRFDDGGAVDNPDIPGAGGSASQRNAALLAQIQASLANPYNRRGTAATASDPVMQAIMSPYSSAGGGAGGGGGGDNSAAMLMARLGVRAPGVVRTGGTMSGVAGYAGGGLSMASAHDPRQHGSYVPGDSGGQDDDVNAKLSSGEYVMDADTVSALGDGNNEAGARKLDAMRTNIRTHKRSAPASDIPPKAKKPEAYLKGGKRK